jgi:hypothetical protein
VWSQKVWKFLPTIKQASSCRYQLSVNLIQFSSDTIYLKIVSVPVDWELGP